MISFRAMPSLRCLGIPAGVLWCLLGGCAGGTVQAPSPPPAPVVAPSAAQVKPPASEPQAASGSANSSPLPPIPSVVGPIAISVVYPKPDAVIQARDSNFVLGSVGTGDAALTINGFSVPVAPNGAFLAWLPVPDSASSRYDLVAVRAADTARVLFPVRLLRSRRWIDDSVAADTMAQMRRPFPDSGRFVTLAPNDSTLPDTDRIVIARPIPGGTYKWFFFPGTVLQVTGRSPGFERVRLDAALSVWVSNSDIKPLSGPAQHREPRRVVERVRVVASPEWVDVVLAIGERPPFLVEENGNDLMLTLYGTQASTDLIHYVGRGSGPPGPPDTLIQSIIWNQETSDRARYTIHLSRAPYGYLAMWTGGNLVLRVRRPPVVDSRTPLRGLTIAVDAGHPPAGSTGPTGLYEPVPTLAVALQVESLLVAQGAKVVMTRTTADPVALTARPVTARRAGAHAMVSIHLNALPDGTNPLAANGTGAYFFHPQSIGLARDLQTGMVAAMGLPDLGVHYDNLAVVRTTWMPAVLCEGAFIIVPEQEAALRTAAFQTAYARGVVDGLTVYFRGLAAGALQDRVPPSPTPASPPPPATP